MQAAFFLDRDGVIIENRPNYVLNWSDVSIYPQAVEALKLLTKTDYKVIIITNQSAVGRGLITEEKAEEINNQLIFELNRMGARIDRVYMCPHAPNKHCSCRKPKPGLILRACQELILDLQSSYLIGDAFTDLSSGKNAGIPNLGIVRTGRGDEQLALNNFLGVVNFDIFENLYESTLFYLNKNNHRR